MYVFFMRRRCPLRGGLDVVDHLPNDVKRDHVEQAGEVWRSTFNVSVQVVLHSHQALFTDS